MTGYWIIVNRKKYVFTYDRKQAENIATENNGYIVEVET